MAEEKKLFLTILEGLHRENLLNDFILIGSWALHIYKTYFDGNAHIPIKRTLDVDFLIPNPPHASHKVDVDTLLKQLGFDALTNPTGTLIKYVHPDLSVEFLMNQKGKGLEDVCTVEEFHVTAVRFRYLSILETPILKVEYKGMVVQVPAPTAYTMHKFIIAERRPNPKKAAKDLETAKELSAYLLTQAEARKNYIELFQGYPRKWQKTILSVTQKECIELFHLLSDPSTVKKR